ncbi:MAG: sulfotransferase domain-containing protein, partial [Lysobacterales bacterium]
MTNAHEPTFFVAGTQKAGTTFLCHQLAIHPEIFFSSPKELLFFQKQDLAQHDYAEYVEQHFSGCGDFIQRGEGSTVYFQSERALSNMELLVRNDYKLIVSLRHPVEKALSFYMHNFVRGRLTGNEDIDQIVSQRQLCHIRQSQYADSFERWLTAIGSARLLVTTLEDLKSSPAETVSTVCDFLQVGPTSTIQLQNRNRGVPYSLDGQSVVPQKTLKLADH